MNTYSSGVDIDTSSTSSQGGFINMFLGQGLGNGVVLAGGITASSNNSSGGDVNLRVQYGNIISIAPLQINVQSAAGSTAFHGGSVYVSSGGASSINVNWQINASGPNGGAIYIEGAGDVQLTNASGLNVSANTSGGTAGAISVISASPNTFTIGSATGSNYIAGTLSIQAPTPTGNAGSLTLLNRIGSVSIPSFSTAINIGLPAGNTQGNGPSLTLGGYTLQVSGVTGNLLDMSGKGTGNGGGITLISSSPVDKLTIGSISGNNYINANLRARSGASGGNGGSIYVSVDNAITALASNFDVAAQGFGGNGGMITVITNSTIPLILTTGASPMGGNSIYGGQLIAASGSGANSTGDGGYVALYNFAGPVYTNEANDIAVPVNATNGNGGHEILYGSSLLIPGDLSANGNGVGNGGIIEATAFGSGLVTSSATGNSYISGNLSATAGAGGGNGGRITLTASQGLVVNNALSTNAVINGNGGIIQLTGDTVTIPGSNLQSFGLGTGNGGDVEITQTNPTSIMTVAGNIKTDPGTGAVSGGGTLGGIVKLVSGSGLFTISGVIETNSSALGSLNATGGVIAL